MTDPRLRSAGPIDPDHGFPLWFEDENGVRLELVLNDDPLAPAVGELPQAGQSIRFPNNFPDEAFYFLAEAELSVGGDGVTGRARVILALEAAFGGAGDPAPGLNVVFARIRVRMDKLIPETEYKVMHPYGEVGYATPLKSDARGRIAYTEDLGLVEGDPTAVLKSGKVAPFLKGLGAVPPEYIGDGASPQKLDGTVLGIKRTFVLIEGPRIREGGGQPDPTAPDSTDRVWTDEFTVQGRKAQRLGAWVDASTYAVNDQGFLLNIQARSAVVPATQKQPDLRFLADGVQIQLKGQNGFYTGLCQVASLPTNPRLINFADLPPTIYPLTFTDRVVVESAIHDRVTNTLTIKAHSSADNAVLTLPQFNNRVLGSPPTISDMVAVPSEIIVASNLGGKGRQSVEVMGPADTADVAGSMVRAIILPLSKAFVGETVTLDGSNSLGATSFAWTKKAGPDATLSAPNAATTDFTPSTPGTYTFVLTASANDLANATEISIVVPEFATVQLGNIRAEYRTGSRQFRLSGTVVDLPNRVAVTFRGMPLGEVDADATKAWSLRYTLSEEEAQKLPNISGNDTINIKPKRPTQAQAANPRLTIRN